MGGYTALKAGAHAGKATSDGGTALRLAAENGTAGRVDLLLKNRANIHLRADDGATALAIAKQNGHLAIAQALRQAGAQEASRTPGWFD